MQLSSVPRLN